MIKVSNFKIIADMDAPFDYYYYFCYCRILKLNNYVFRKGNATN